MNHYVYVIDMMEDISKVNDYLKMGLDRHFTSDHTSGGEERNRTFT